MPDEEKLAPIIIIKKKGGHGGHHGGAWKVAYADFVTAMMALFIVLWLLSSSEQTKKAVGGYFTDPNGSGKMMGSSMAGVGRKPCRSARTTWTSSRRSSQEAMRQLPKFKQMKDQVQMTVTGEGLRDRDARNGQGNVLRERQRHPSEAGKEILVSTWRTAGQAAE